MKKICSPKLFKLLATLLSFKADIALSANPVDPARSRVEYSGASPYCFRNTAMCSPACAALLANRNRNRVIVGLVSAAAAPLPISIEPFVSPNNVCSASRKESIYVAARSNGVAVLIEHDRSRRDR